jgi:ATP-dependent RNA helicase DeaD
MSFPIHNPALQRALAQREYTKPTPVQTAVLDAQAEGRDLLVSAQTGSGKTIAYGLALAPTLIGNKEKCDAPTTPLALIIAPTRELAMQVQAELHWLYASTSLYIASSIGGMDIRREMRTLDAGCHIVVGTPGRLRDHIEHGRLDVSHLRAIVLDEADEMLNLGFREDMEFILEATPADRRTLLFSATIPRDIAQLARRYQRDALRIDTIDQAQPHSDIDYRAMLIVPNEIEHAVVNVLRFYESTSTIIFCKTREAVRHLQTSLSERGFSTVALSGEYSQNERNNALQSLRNGRARVCVATDVAARGIDLPGLDLVIHAELPNDRDTLLHRSGRTGRAGRKGMSILLVPVTRRRAAETLIAKARVEAQWIAPPSADDIRRADLNRMKADPLFALPNTAEDLDLITHLQSQFGPEDIAGAFVRLYRSRFPAAEDICLVSDQAKQRTRERGAKFDKGPREHADRPPRHESAFPHASSEPMQWFRMSLGRKTNADPKWLIPLICRLGHITKKEIGHIKIFDTETKFEITAASAAKFEANIKRAEDPDNINIQPAHAPEGAPPRRGKPSKPKFKGGKPRDDAGHKNSKPPFAKYKNKSAAHKKNDSKTNTKKAHHHAAHKAKKRDR